MEQIPNKKIKDEIPKSVIVLWSDAPMAKFMSSVRPRALLEYTVEINPPTEAPLKSHLYHDIPDFTGVNNPVATIGETKSLISSINKKGSGTSFISDATDEEFGNAMASMYKYSTRFDGLKDNTDYTVSISTELDGKTITQVTMTAVSKSGSSSPGASESQPQHQEHNNKKDS